MAAELSAMNGSGRGASVALTDLEKRFDRTNAVDGVSLDIRSGEFLTLLGPSGSGKTTTLMMIAGFETPTAGDIAIDAKSVVAMQWVAAMAIKRSRLVFGRDPFMRAAEENDRIWRFMLQTNVSNSVGMFWMQVGTLAVGAVSGAAEAGAFRLAQRLAKGILRPVRPVTVALYPELSRLVAEDDHSQLRTVVVRVTLAAAALAFMVVLVTGIAGKEILSIIAGKQFEFAYGFLFLLSIAAAIDLAGFALEPLQDAHGRSWIVLRAKLVAAATYAILLLLLLPIFGGQGAAMAAIICSLAIFIQLAVATASILRKRREPIVNPDEPTQPTSAS
jgi:O-antigen/teichoic acid export membrane protein